MEHPKQVLSKTQILEKVFDADGEFIEENTLAAIALLQLILSFILSRNRKKESLADRIRYQG